MAKVRMKHSQWSVAEREYFILCFQHEDLNDVAFAFDLKDAKSCHGTASKLRARGIDVPYRS